MEANTSMTFTSLWFDGVCDRVLIRVSTWYMNYENGEVCKDQDFLTKDGDVIKMPTMHAMKMPWNLQELSHLGRIVSIRRPGTQLAAEVCSLDKKWKKGILLAIPGNYRVMTLMFYKEHVKEILDCLLEAKNAQASKNFDKDIQDLSNRGKDIFEI